LGLAFFGLTSNNIGSFRAALFSQIHQIVFYGNGGYDWHTVYNMPIWLRLNLLLMKLKNILKRKMKLYKNNLKEKTQTTKTVIDSDGKVKLPGLLQNPTNSKKPVKYG
jgi:hypothetical protein